MNVARQGRGTLVVCIHTEAAAVVVEVQLVVVVEALQFGGIDGIAARNAPIGRPDGDGGLVVGSQVRLEMKAVHRSLSTNAVARLVALELQSQLACRPRHIVRIVRGAVIALSKYAVRLHPELLQARLGTNFGETTDNGQQTTDRFLRTHIPG